MSSLNFKHFLFSFFIFSSFVLGQKTNERQHEIDSLEQKIAQQDGNEKAKTILKLNNLYYSQANDSMVLVTADEGLKYATDSYIKGKLIFNKAGIYTYLGNRPMQIKLFKEAIPILIGANDSLAAQAMNWLHRGYQISGMYPEALDIGLKELKFREQHLEKDEQYLIANAEIGFTYDRMNEYHKAIEWHRKSLNIAKELKNDFEIGYANGLIGIAYDELAEYDSALYYNKIAIKYFKKEKDTISLSTWYSNIGNTYTKLNDLKNAEEYTRASLAIGSKEKPSAVTLINLGKILLEQGKQKEAESILDSAMKEIDKRGGKRFLSEAYYRFHELRVKQNDYKSALDYYVKFKENEDEMFTETKAEQINEMSIQYETAEKEKQILIQRADIAEKELKLQRRSYFIIGLIALASIIGLLGYLFWNQQKLKNQQLQKENELKDALLKIETQNKLQEQRLRISRDLHDNIGAQLTFIISSIDNLKYAFSIDDQRLSGKLDQISHFASDTIYELRDTIWAMNQSEISFDDLQARVTNFIDKANLSKSKTTFNFDVDESINSEKIFNSIQGMNVYRIIQEAVNNAMKYSDADAINVKVKKSLNKIKISIVDNGKGFDKQNVERGNGLLTMQKRAADLGSLLHIHSEKEKGTEISFEI